MPVKIVKLGNSKQVESTIRILRRSLSILSRKDQLRAYLAVFIYAILGLLDLLAALTFGVVGSLTVNGLSANEPGDRVYQLLDFLGISEFQLDVQIAILGIVASAILVSKSVASFYLSKKTLFFLGRRGAFISRELIEKMFANDVLIVKQNSLQKTIFALTSGVQAVTAGILGASLLLIADLFLILIFSVSLFLVDTLVAVLSLLIFSVVGTFLFVIMNKRAKDLGQVATSRGVESNDRIFEAIMCYRELLVKNRRNYYAEKIGKLQLGMAESQAHMSFLSLISKYVIEITIVAGSLIVGATQILLHPPQRAIAVISVFLVASARLAPAVLRVQTGFLQLRNAIGVAGPTIALIENHLSSRSARPMEVADIDSRKEAGDFSPSIEVSGLKFRYPLSRKNVLDGISFNLNPGEFISIVGSSGAGKSTLVDVLLGVLNPTEGEVRISGYRPIDCIKKFEGLLSYVPQEASLINGTIKENICLGFDQNDFNDSLIENLLSDLKLEDLLSNSD